MVGIYTRLPRKPSTRRAGVCDFLPHGFLLNSYFCSFPKIQIGILMNNNSKRIDKKALSFLVCIIQFYAISILVSHNLKIILKRKFPLYATRLEVVLLKKYNNWCSSQRLKTGESQRENHMLFFPFANILIYHIQIVLQNKSRTTLSTPFGLQ